MNAYRRFKNALISLGGAIFPVLLGCGSNTAATSAPTPPPIQPGYPAASTQRWLREFASTGAPGLIANQSNSPTDALPGAAGTLSGGVVLAGFTAGTYPGNTNASGNAQAVVLRFDSQGNQLWTQQFGTGLGDFLISAATDASENIYVAGTSNGTYPGQNTFSGTKALLLKLDRSGNRLWLKEFNFGPSNTSITAVATDGTGGLFVTGIFAPLTSSKTQHSFVMRVDPATGAGLWTVQYGADGVITSMGGLAAASGAVYLAGTNLSASSPVQQTSDVQRLDSATGLPSWSQNIANLSTASLVTGITLGQDGNPVIAGSFSSAQKIIVGYGADPSTAGFLSKLDVATGKSSWTVQVNSGAGDEISSITSVGGFFYAAGFSNGVLASSYKAQNSSEFLLKVNGSGDVVWVQQFGTGRILNIEEPYGLIATTDGISIYLSGPTQTAFPGFTSNGLVQNVVSSWSQ